MRILMNLNVSKETFRNHRGILRTCFFFPFLSGPRARLLRLGRLGPRQGNQRNRSTCENSGRNESLRPFTTDAHDHLLPVCFVQQGASSSNGATVPAAEPLKPKLQVGQNEIKNSKGFLNHSSSKSKALMGASVFSSLKRTAYHQLPPRRPACTSE